MEQGMQRTPKVGHNFRGSLHLSHREVLAAVGVEAAEEEVDAEVGDDDAEEGEGAVEEEGFGAASDFQGGMHGEGVDDEGDERPDFLGVPGPVVAPGDVGPEGADDDAEGEEEDGGIEEALCQIEN